LQIAPAILLLANRYVPLALTILGAVIVNILCFHIFMAARGLAVGCRRYNLVVSYDLECAFRVRGNPSTLS